METDFDILYFMWIILALGASLFWGLTYVFNEQVYKHISVTTSLALASMVIFVFSLLISIFSNNFSHDISAILSSRKLLMYVILGIITLLIAELFIGFSIVAKNATIAGLIEISYPIFIALFSYLLFKNNHLTFSSMIGGLLIFSGIFVIYFFNK